MRLTNQLLSIVALIFTSLLTLSGLNCLLISWSKGYRFLWIRMLEKDSIWIDFMGFLMLSLSILLMIVLYNLTKKTYLHIQMGPQILSLDKNVIAGYLSVYWKERFPKKQISCDIDIGNNKIEISADLPTVPLEEQEDLLQKIESDLGHLFHKQFGYQKEFIFCAHFPPSSTS